MQQNFFNSETYHSLLARLEKLRSSDRPKWGIMNPAQMFKHLQLENDLALGNYHGKDHSNFLREKAFKLVIKGIMPLPAVFSKLRMIKAIPELDVVKSKIPVHSFEQEKKTLLVQFDKLFHAQKFAGLHPAIGKMNREEWGYFYVWHTDYHLKQFGL